MGEWVWDAYAAYGTEAVTDPTGAETGVLHVYRGGGWNDFAKNMRSAYRATMDFDKSAFNTGMRLALNAAAGMGVVKVSARQENAEPGRNKILIAYFSWGGNTRSIAQEAQRQTGADIFEITMIHPYSGDYNTVLEEAQRDQKMQARPQLAGHVSNMAQYDVILLGYPNWWASIPMPVASFLEEHDFSGKTIVPFCSHGGGRFGQSITAIAKLAPQAKMGEALSVHYGGGSDLNANIGAWLRLNGLAAQ